METRYRTPTPLELQLRTLADADIRGPLWNWPPDVRPAVQHERRRRFQWDDEPIGDVEYS